jgi:hypothetical protein
MSRLARKIDAPAEYPADFRGMGMKGIAYASVRESPRITSSRDIVVVLRFEVQCIEPRSCVTKHSLASKMILPIVGMALGLMIGAVLAGEMGAALGTVFGMVVGLMWQSVRKATSRPLEDPIPQSMRERVLCIPNGQVAECMFTRDQRTGRWMDVESCSLCDPPTQVRCAKRCLVLMNDAASTGPGSRWWGSLRNR